VQPSCKVALEACGGAHQWARQLTQLGHEVRLIPPAYVKPFAKRQKNDAIDAEAICEAAQRPSMRFVAVMSEEQQAAGLLFRTRDLLMRQRTQLINAIRGHLTEYGWIVPKVPSHVSMLADLIEEEMASSLPEAAHAMFRLMLDLLAGGPRNIDIIICVQILNRMHIHPGTRASCTVMSAGFSIDGTTPPTWRKFPILLRILS
jgi:transposase